MYKKYLMDFVDLCRAFSYLSFLVVFEGRRDLDVCGHWLPKTLSFRVRAIFQPGKLLPHSVKCMPSFLEQYIVY